MAEDHWLKSNIVFGSAGMAASGMLPKPVVKKKKIEPRIVVEAPPEVEEDLEEDAEIEEEALETAAEEITQVHGYGIHAKAQGVYADLRAGIISDGERTLDGVDWDNAFSDIDNIVVAGFAEEDEEILAEFQKQHEDVEDCYSDYREMIARTKPNIVALPQAGTANRYDIIKTCLMAGTHVICPAPLTRSLSDADELLALADRRGLKIAVSMPLRVDPNVMRFFQMRQGLIGDLVEIRVLGEMDENSGGEDLLLKGAPLFDLVRMFAGDPVWCSSTIATDGVRSTREDIIDDPDNPYGLTVGDIINAQVYTDHDVMVNFVSNRKLKHVSGGWGMEFIGSHSVMRLLGGDQPKLSLLENPGQKEATCEEHWGIWPENQETYHYEEEGLSNANAAHRLVVYDWLAGITEDREAKCSGKRATKALEIVHAIWQSGITGKRVYFPMVNRHHPLVPELRPYEKTA